ncbi:hypothetical protein [Streptomyces uncialis]|uniref:hypothetical protein n=1 Tax=Streptomyces uncialis TaxID=1048205 RepID=UPI003868AB0A|nr:hypothetical protein OG924_12435 [Streptomyces uncialis]
MADEDAQQTPGADSQSQENEGGEGGEPPPAATFEMELVDSLPGGRVVLGVEEDGLFTWLAVRGHVSEQAREELIDQLKYIVEQGLWVQNWGGETFPPQSDDTPPAVT